MQYIFENKGNWLKQIQEGTVSNGSVSYPELALFYSLGGTVVKDKPAIMCGLSKITYVKDKAAKDDFPAGEAMEDAKKILDSVKPQWEALVKAMLNELSKAGYKTKVIR